MSTRWLHTLIEQGERDRFAQALKNPLWRGFAAGKTEDGGTLLHAAIRAGWTDMIAPLCDAGAAAHAGDAKGTSPLHLAAAAGFQDVCALLIKRGANPDAAAESGETPLHAAIAAGHVGCAALLLGNGADPKAKNPQTPRGMNAWHIAATTGNPDMMGLLLAHPDHAHMNDFCDIGRTQGDTFRIALRTGAPDVVKQLLAHGVSINGRDDSGRTPLHWILTHRLSRAEGLPMVRLLLQNGADGDRAASPFGDTPLMTAAKADFPEALRLLIENGADVNRSNRRQETALHYAAEHYTLETIRILMDAGADINAADQMRQTPLHIAARRNRRDVVKTLLAYDADPFCVDRRGRTPDRICLSPIMAGTRFLVMQAQQDWMRRGKPIWEKGRLRRRFNLRTRMLQRGPRHAFIKKPPSNRPGYRP